MDVRCEKCQTEYELDETRLKPGGVTVKCTHCGHMFRIRKRTITNVGHGPGTPGSPLPGGGSGSTMRSRPNSSRALAAPSPKRRPDSIFDDDARAAGPDEPPTVVERQWLLRLDNGEQKSCRELATLQQWIVSGVVSRESLISRTGKTWKRLGDIADLGQYFDIADEARATRDRVRPLSRPAGGDTERRGQGTPPLRGAAGGHGAPQAAGGTIVPDDDDTGEIRPVRPAGRPGANTPPPLPTRGASRTPGPVPTLPSAAAAAGGASPGSARDVRATPPPPPKRVGAASGPTVLAPSSGPVPAVPAQPPAIPPPVGNRATADWAHTARKPEVSEAEQSGPFVGKLSAIPDEPAFAGRVRIAPGDTAPFDPDRVRAVDDDDQVLPAQRGSRAGMWVLIIALLVMGAGAAVIYLLVLRPAGDDPSAPPENGSAAPVAVVAVDARAPSDAPAVTPPLDALSNTVAPAAGPRAELAADIEPRLRTAAQSLDDKPDAPSQALRAHVLAQLAQDLLDRAGLLTGADADNLRKDAKQLVLDAATSAQRALRAAADDPGANVAMAAVLRLQGKPARDVKRYLDTARARSDKDWTVELALAEATLAARDGKLDDARAAFAAIDQGDGKLETSGDVRARFHLALTLALQGKAADAKPLVDAVLAAQPEHAGARALAGKLETMVARTDPLPPEDGTAGNASAGSPSAGSAAAGSAAPPPGRPPAAPPAPRPAPPAPSGGESYERLLARANALAESSCSKAMEFYARALELKTNGVEALVGMGYCHIEAKRFASAFSNFRAALAVSPRYEPALRGIAEAYQQQGRKADAIEAYKAYLDVYPGNAAVKKQLERLGGESAAGAGAPSAPASPAPASPPAAPENPPPAPSEPAGAGSGSG